MTADVVALTERKPKVVGVVNVVRESLRVQTPRDLAIERCVDEIASFLDERLTIHQRIGLERALDALVDEIAWHRRDPWD